MFLYISCKINDNNPKHANALIISATIYSSKQKKKLFSIYDVKASAYDIKEFSTQDLAYSAIHIRFRSTHTALYFLLEASETDFIFLPDIMLCSFPFVDIFTPLW